MPEIILEAKYHSTDSTRATNGVTYLKHFASLIYYFMHDLTLFFHISSLYKFNHNTNFRAVVAICD